MSVKNRLLEEAYARAEGKGPMTVDEALDLARRAMLTAAEMGTRVDDCMQLVERFQEQSSAALRVADTWRQRALAAEALVVELAKAARTLLTRGPEPLAQHRLARVLEKVLFHASPAGDKPS